MNVKWGKSAQVFHVVFGSARSLAAWLIVLAGVAVCLSAELDETLIKQPFATVFDRLHPAQLAGCPSDSVGAGDDAVENIHTGSRFSYEMKLLATGLAVAEQRRVCAWKKLAEQGAGASLLAFGWLTAAIVGTLSLVGPFRNRRYRRNRLAGPHAVGQYTIVSGDTSHFVRCFEQAADGMLLLRITGDGSFTCEDMNLAWQAMFRQNAASCYGRQPHEAWSSDISDAMVDKLGLCLATGHATQFDVHLIGPPARALQILISPLREPTGRMTALLCLARDNTEQIRFAERVQHEQRLETVRRLSAGVAHDFNNILQAICGGLELIVDEAGPAPAIRELANIALVAAQRGSHLTQHLLAYARRQVLTPQAVDLREFLPRMRLALEQAIGPANDLDLEFCGDHATIFVDEVNLRTALLNLAFNAGRAMPNGGCLRIETNPDQIEQRCGVSIVISDTGEGMDAETLQRCHEPFFTTKGATGTGLGLSMVQGFAIQSGGALRLSSRPGHGTVAVLTLPAGLSPSTEEVCGPIGVCVGRVLLVDDAAEVLVTTGRMLQRAGLHVTSVQSGDAALAELAAGQVFDIVVTDYAMPGLSGVELIRLAREMQPGLPGLIITGFHEVDISRLEETASVLRKPFARQDLLAAIAVRITPHAPVAQPPPGAAAHSDI
jgi:signal transduction histidine kinase/CheY-like chemotaxis protein